MDKNYIFGIGRHHTSLPHAPFPSQISSLPNRFLKDAVKCLLIELVTFFLLALFPRQDTFCCLLLLKSTYSFLRLVSNFQFSAASELPSLNITCGCLVSRKQPQLPAISLGRRRLRRLSGSEDQCPNKERP